MAEQKERVIATGFAWMRVGRCFAQLDPLYLEAMHRVLVSQLTEEDLNLTPVPGESPAEALADFTVVFRKDDGTWCGLPLLATVDLPWPEAARELLQPGAGRGFRNRPLAAVPRAMAAAPYVRSPSPRTGSQRDAGRYSPRSSDSLYGGRYPGGMKDARNLYAAPPGGPADLSQAYPLLPLGYSPNMFSNAYPGFGPDFANSLAVVSGLSGNLGALAGMGPGKRAGFPGEMDPRAVPGLVPDAASLAGLAGLGRMAAGQMLDQMAGADGRMGVVPPRRDADLSLPVRPLPHMAPSAAAPSQKTVGQMLEHISATHRVPTMREAALAAGTLGGFPPSSGAPRAIAELADDRMPTKLHPAPAEACAVAAVAGTQAGGVQGRLTATPPERTASLLQASPVTPAMGTGRTESVAEDAASAFASVGGRSPALSTRGDEFPPKKQTTPSLLNMAWPSLGVSSLPPAHSTVQDAVQCYMMDDAFFDSDGNSSLGAEHGSRKRSRSPSPAGSPSERKRARLNASVPSSRHCMVSGLPQRMLYHVFRGRRAECMQLRGLLLHPDTRIVTVSGRGGMGKTCLSLHVLHDLEEDLAVCGIVYAGHHTTGLDLATIVTLCSQVLPDPAAATACRELARVATTLGARAVCDSLLRWIASSPNPGLFILLLDNLEDVLCDDGTLRDPALREFYEAVCATGGRLRICGTSRIPPVLPPALRASDLRLMLDTGIDTAEGIALLRDLDPSRVCGLRDADASLLGAIMEATHGAPRALEVVAGMLAADPFLKPDTVLARLRGEYVDSSDQIAALVEDAFKRLDGPGRQIVEVLAVFSVPVPLGAVERAMGGASELNHLVRAMARAHHVLVDRESGCISLHPLDVAYALSQLAAQRRIELERAAAEYYRSVQRPIKKLSDTAGIAKYFAEMKHLVNAREYDRAARVLARVDTEHPCYVADAYPNCGPVGTVLVHSRRYASSIADLLKGLRGDNGEWLVSDETLCCDLAMYSALVGLLFSPEETSFEVLLAAVARAEQTGDPECISQICGIVALSLTVSNAPLPAMLAVAEPAYMLLCALMDAWPLQPGTPEWPPFALTFPARQKMTLLWMSATSYYLPLALMGRDAEARGVAASVIERFEKMCPPGKLFVVEEMKIELAVGLREYSVVLEKIAPALDAVAAGASPLAALERVYGAENISGFFNDLGMLTLIVKSLMGTRTHLNVTPAFVETYINLPEISHVLTDFYWQALVALAYHYAQRMRDVPSARKTLARIPSLSSAGGPVGDEAVVITAVIGIVSAVHLGDRPSERSAILSFASALAPLYAPYNPFPHSSVFVEDAKAIR